MRVPQIRGFPSRAAGGSLFCSAARAMGQRPRCGESRSEVCRVCAELYRAPDMVQKGARMTEKDLIIQDLRRENAELRARVPKYPCVYYEKKLCKKFSKNGVTSFCVMGPCQHETPSNADRIRSMSDKELSKFFCPDTPRNSPWCEPIGRTKCSKAPCQKCMLKWLRQPAEEDE